MMEDKLGDWRKLWVDTIAADIPPAFPGGPSHKKGTVVDACTVVKNIAGEYIGFITPSPTALALDIAYISSKRALKLKKRFKMRNNLVSPFDGPNKDISPESTTFLFNYFESCMIAITFSFQSLEIFSNEIIANNLNGTFPLIRKGETINMTATEIERRASTEEKIGIILPHIYKIESPKGKVAWESFKKLKEKRDSTVHLKSWDAYKAKPDEETLFYQLYTCNIEDFLSYSIQVIDYFTSAYEGSPRWFNLAKEKLESIKDCNSGYN